MAEHVGILNIKRIDILILDFFPNETWKSGFAYSFPAVDQLLLGGGTETYAFCPLSQSYFPEVIWCAKWQESEKSPSGNSKGRQSWIWVLVVIYQLCDPLQLISLNYLISVLHRVDIRNQSLESDTLGFIPALLHTSCVTSSTSLNLSGLVIWGGKYNASLIRYVGWRWNVLCIQTNVWDLESTMYYIC